MRLSHFNSQYNATTPRDIAEIINASVEELTRAYFQK